jgi:hypothetical protein
MTPRPRPARPASRSGRTGRPERVGPHIASIGPLPYTAPRLRLLGDADSLLEVLGPAQANYGGF